MFFVKINRAIPRGIAVLFAGLMVGLLNSCGSGAVSAPDPAAGTALAVSPGTADVFPDVPVTFTVTGGTPAYSAFSSNSVALPITATVAGATFTVVANSVTADTAVDITVRDAANKSTTAKANVRPAVLNNVVTFLPVGPTGTGCGSGLCSGGDAQVTVKAVLNGVVLRARPIRFDAYSGNFQIVTPGTGVLVSTLVVNTDERGEAVVRITAAPAAATQTATIQSTDTISGLSRRYNFNIIQQTSGAGILSILPAGSVTITGLKGAPGQIGSCPNGARVDYYVYGGTPPYSVASPAPAFATPFSTPVATSGGSFGVLVTGCGTVAMLVTDASGRVIESPQIIAERGADNSATSIPLTIVPPTMTIGCGQSASVSLIGSGTFISSVTTPGASPNFTVSPTSGPLPATVTFTRTNIGTVPTSIIINFVSGTTIVPFAVTVQTGTSTPLTPGSCP